MHADSAAVELASRVAVTGVSFERIDVEAFVHLRSGGRGSELDELTEFAQDALGVSLAITGEFADMSSQASPTKVECVAAMRTRPSEIVFWSVRRGRESSTVESLQTIEQCRARASRSPLLHVVDATHGQAAFSLAGAHARQLLQRLADDTSLPKSPGTAVRLRLADLHVTLAWLTTERYVLLADVLYADFLAERVAYAAGVLADPL